MGGNKMKMHGCKTLFIVLAAVLCLFGAGGAISSKVFSPAEVSAGTADPAGAAGADRVVGADGVVGSDRVVGVDGAAESAGYDDSAGSDDSAVPALSCRYYNERDFLKSVNQAVPTENIAAGPVNTARSPAKGGIVPHHLLAGRMIAAFFDDLAQDPPGTIILLGPNHRLVGSNEVHTSSADWLTAFGTLKADSKLTKVLTDRINASENNRLMEDEHSISSLVPYIKYYMPDTKIVPVLLHGSYTQEQSKELGALLAEIVTYRPDAVILASIDFSHYLNVIEADRMDEMTLAAISSRNFDELGRMNNDNLDSPPSILTLLSAMDDIGAVGPDVIGHDNSYGITGTSADYTTSYYTMLFRR